MKNLLVRQHKAYKTACRICQYFSDGTLSDGLFFVRWHFGTPNTKQGLKSNFR